MRSVEILADYLACFDCPDAICDQIPATQKNHEICTKCWLDWSRSKADEKEVVFTEEEKYVFSLIVSFHLPQVNHLPEFVSLKTKILGK